jgi:hypothetical protein
MRVTRRGGVSAVCQPDLRADTATCVISRRPRLSPACVAGISAGRRSHPPGAESRATLLLCVRPYGAQLQPFSQPGAGFPGPASGLSALDSTVVPPMRFPHCVVWAPEPPLSWLYPFIGHVGASLGRDHVNNTCCVTCCNALHPGVATACAGFDLFRLRGPPIAPCPHDFCVSVQASAAAAA